MLAVGVYISGVGTIWLDSNLIEGSMFTNAGVFNLISTGIFMFSDTGPIAGVMFPDTSTLLDGLILAQVLLQVGVQDTYTQVLMDWSYFISVCGILRQ